jgi:hypothetical protein
METVRRARAARCVVSKRAPRHRRAHDQPFDRVVVLRLHQLRTGERFACGKRAARADDRL